MLSAIELVMYKVELRVPLSPANPTNSTVSPLSAGGLRRSWGDKLRSHSLTLGRAHTIYATRAVLYYLRSKMPNVSWIFKRLWPA